MFTCVPFLQRFILHQVDIFNLWPCTVTINFIYCYIVTSINSILRVSHPWKNHKYILMKEPSDLITLGIDCVQHCIYCIALCTPFDIIIQFLDKFLKPFVKWPNPSCNSATTLYYKLISQTTQPFPDSLTTKVWSDCFCSLKISKSKQTEVYFTFSHFLKKPNRA